MSTEAIAKKSRRNFIAKVGLTAAALASGWSGYSKFLRSRKYQIRGRIVGANFKAGHLLRTGVNQTPTAIKNVDTIIVGGGIAGLSAAWWLKRNGFHDFVLLEMDNRVGGNSTSDSNSITRYPWGAHYVPLPGPDARYVRELFEEIGVIQGYENNLPKYNEYYLCADPHERLLFQGEWQDGLIPQQGIQADDRRQYDEFFAYVESLKDRKGSDNRFAFSIPVDFSSQDPEFLELDKLSMADFMLSRGWKSRYLNWYVNYCCRDDYGMPHNQVSAWAGLHYFASRSGVAANAGSHSVLTWPEGNGFLVNKLKGIVHEHIRQNSLVFAIETPAQGSKVDVLNLDDNSCLRYQAQNVIYCAPRYTANKVIKGFRKEVSLDYAPWLIANISLNERPVSGGAQLAWDNVSFYSKSLGYIVANHQDLKFNQRETVITYFLPLDESSPKIARISAYQKSYEDWLDIVVDDLEKMHPGISGTITNVDLWVWGHGMVSPGIDYLWSTKRKEFNKPFGSIEFAHSDMSGVSIFEEAQYRGVEAAKRILAKART